MSFFNGFNLIVFFFRLQTDNAKAVVILLENGANPNASNEMHGKSVLQTAFLHSMFHTIFK